MITGNKKWSKSEIEPVIRFLHFIAVLIKNQLHEKIVSDYLKNVKMSNIPMSLHQVLSMRNGYFKSGLRDKEMARWADLE